MIWIVIQVVGKALFARNESKYVGLDLQTSDENAVSLSAANT